MSALSDDEEEIDPVKMLLLEEDEQEKKLHTPLIEAGKPQMQQHYINSIDSTVVTRQLPSEGLSFQLWPAATTLLTLLDHHRGNASNSPLTSTLPVRKHPHRLKILELGSGTGLVGIAAAVTLGSEVTVTDLPHVIPNLQFNVDANTDVIADHGGTVRAAPLRWGEEEDMEVIGRDYDLVLASDVVYHDHLYDPLMKTLRFLLCGGGEKEVVFVMAHLRRWKKDSAFFKKAKKLFDVETLHVDQPKDGSRTGVVVYRFVAKSRNLVSNNA